MTDSPSNNPGQVRTTHVRDRVILLAVAVAVALGGYTLGASYSPLAKAKIVGAKVGLSKGEGFDTCSEPEESVLQEMWPSTHYSYIGLYIGGPTGKQNCSPLPSRNYFSKVHAQGWDFLPIFDGLQAPCNEGISPKFSANPAESFKQARTEAAEEADHAAGQLQRKGFITRPGTIVYYDLENFEQTGNPNCKAATEEYINNWDRRMELEYEVTPGLYGSANASHLDQFWGIKYKPADIWIGDAIRYGYNEEALLEKSVFKASIPSADWPNRRLRQYETGREQDVYVGSVKKTVTIDRDCAYGLVAGQGEKKDEPECYEK